jgi:hypothetical protein
MRERCSAGLQYGVSDAERKVQPLPARMKKLTEISIIRRLKVSAFCQIFYEHFQDRLLLLIALYLPLLLQGDFYPSTFDLHQMCPGNLHRP